ncbi:MAG: hypothetical protein AAF502_02920 [Bacteroidota bacterium]
MKHLSGDDRKKWHLIDILRMELFLMKINYASLRIILLTAIFAALWQT